MAWGKDLFHEPSVKVPLIVCDPSPEADGARGTVCDELVETIDLVPTFIDALGGDLRAQSHRLEGRSLTRCAAKRRRNGATTPSASMTI